MSTSFDPQNQAEFDRHATGYDSMHQASIRASGEDPAYFARYKRDCLLRVLGGGGGGPLLDFGCGIGNLTTELVGAFAEVEGYDPSSECVKIARERAPACTFHDDVDAIPRSRYRAVVVANVLHHVKPVDRPALVAKAAATLAPGGKLVVFEHNPLNPVTRRAVAACPFDDDAELLYPWTVTRLLRGAGLAEVDLSFIVFFPRPLARLRPLEPRLRRLPAGAQVMAVATRR
ncbi:MAG: class I SAM-dependent methyltransferase [Myxococcales bacterium]|jgi:2-polyprenyl-3-methyl-5-hydroxy-6-metoxy-1,4-benzoquinol methylase|nr:class I SAM-dependent methyltransferase [Myxococcales bacterium]